MKTNTRTLSLFRPFGFKALLILISLCVSSSYTQTPYSLSDLEVLREGRNFKEFFLHAKDILPTKRDKNWRNMLSGMVSEYIDNLIKENKFNRESFIQIEKLSQWPEQKNDRFFQYKRNNYALRYFKNCLSSKTNEPVPPTKLECQRSMRHFWSSSNKDIDSGYQMLLLHIGFFPNQDSSPYLPFIVKGEFSENYCKEPIVIQEFLKYLEKINTLEIAKEQLKKKVLALASPSCWEIFKPKIIKNIRDKPTKQTEVIFKLSSTLDFLSKVESDLWLIRYYLENPEPGEYLNRAWYTLKVISQNYKRRMSVLRKLTLYDPLPGYIFSLPNHQTRKALTRNFGVNFPEYLSEYAKTCMKYLSGVKVFPHGNPTKECHDLMALDKKLSQEKFLSDEIHLKYSAIEKRNGR